MSPEVFGKTLPAYFTNHTNKKCDVFIEETRLSSAIPLIVNKSESNPCNFHDLWIKLNYTFSEGKCKIQSTKCRHNLVNQRTKVYLAPIKGTRLQ